MNYTQDFASHMRSLTMDPNPNNSPFILGNSHYIDCYNNPLKNTVSSHQSLEYGLPLGYRALHGAGLRRESKGQYYALYGDSSHLYEKCFQRQPKIGVT